jgi:hypothetical protein
MQHALGAGPDPEAQPLFLPVSCAIERDRKNYYQTLDTLSRQIMKKISHQVDAQGQVQVSGDTRDLYRYPDLTAFTAYLGAKTKEAAEQDLVTERQTLATYDQALPKLREIGQISSKDLDLFFRFCKQNGWKLSARKRTHFPDLTDGQIHEMEAALAKTAQTIDGGA